MTWAEFSDARLLMAEERLGAKLRAHDRGELGEEEQGQALLRARGMVG